MAASNRRKASSTKTIRVTLVSYYATEMANVHEMAILPSMVEAKESLNTAMHTSVSETK
jgi:hypothetical protein